MLKGKKIVLRPLLDSDLEFLYKIENDEETEWESGEETEEDESDLELEDDE